MMYDHDEKLRAVTLALEETLSPNFFLTTCWERGLMAGHRDTIDEFGEFISWSVKHVPSSIHAIRASLMRELTKLAKGIPPAWALARIFGELAYHGNRETALCMHLMMSRMPKIIEDEYIATMTRRKDIADMPPMPKAYLDNRMVLAYHAAAYTDLMTDYDRMMVIGELLEMYASEDKDYNKATIVAAIATHAGLFGLSSKQFRRVMDPLRYWRYRIPAVAAVITLLGYHYNWEIVAKLWDDITMGNCGVVRDKAGGNVVPTSEIFLDDNGRHSLPDWGLVGGKVPSFYHGFVNCAGGFFIQGQGIGLWVPAAAGWKSKYINRC